jgi:hypothetical protein
MRVEPAKQASSGGGSFMLHDDAPAEHDAPAGRSLVVTAPQAAQQPANNYRQAQFLAHLIATKDQLPQTRERRRAEPSVAIAAYRAVEAITG